MATTFAAGVLLGAISLLNAVASVGQHSADGGISASRVQKVLSEATDQLRRASLATARDAADTTFADGESGTEIRYRVVDGFAGAPVLSAVRTLRFVRPAGAAEGEVQLDDGVQTIVLARGVSAFSVTRTGSAFTITATARSGPPDDRARTTSGAIVARPRCP